MSDDKKGRKKIGAGKAPPGKDGPTRDVGSALRSVYQRAVEEDIPADLLDLLGKLG